MNNQELASLLIETANEILAEGANNKYVENAGKELKKIYMKHVNDVIEETDKLSNLIDREKERVAHGKDPKELKKLEKEYNTLDKRFSKNYHELRQAGKFAGKTLRKYSSDPNSIILTKQRRENKERFNKDFASPKSSTNNARITERGKADEKRVAKAHGLRNKVNNESIALLLMEAAELLSNDDTMLEAIARDTRKDVVKSVKDLKKEREVKDFLSGNFSKKDGQKKYNEISKELDKLMELIQSIPKETTGEKF